MNEPVKTPITKLRLEIAGFEKSAVIVFQNKKRFRLPRGRVRLFKPVGETLKRSLIADVWVDEWYASQKNLVEASGYQLVQGKAFVMLTLHIVSYNEKLNVLEIGTAEGTSVFLPGSQVQSSKFVGLGPNDERLAEVVVTQRAAIKLNLVSTTIQPVDPKVEVKIGDKVPSNNDVDDEARNNDIVKIRCKVASVSAQGITVKLSNFAVPLPLFIIKAFKQVHDTSLGGLFYDIWIPLWSANVLNVSYMDVPISECATFVDEYVECDTDAGLAEKAQLLLRYIKTGGKHE